MTTLRSETRESLAWCLEQNGPITAIDLYKSRGVSQTTANQHLVRFTQLGVMERTGKPSGWTYWITDREQAEVYINEKPVKKNWRTNAKTNVWNGANSVFSLGA